MRGPSRDRCLVLGWFAPLALALVVSGCPSTPAPVDAGGATDTDPVLPDVPLARCTGDDECSDGSFCNGRERCDASAVGADARGCAPSRGRPCLDVQVCLEATDACETDCGADRDADDDGADAASCPGGTDCDDADPLRRPGLTEVCDGDDHDEDCDPTTFGERDLDRDGAVDGRCCNEDRAGVRACGDDCDDARRSVRPLGTEVCDGLDNDCNDSIDEGVAVLAYVDGDRDLHGEAGATTMACPGAAGVSSVDDDCDGTSRARHGAQVEICDEVDNDCDGRVDENTRPVTWYRDADGDGFGAAASGTMVSCAPLDGYALVATDCDDGNRSRSPLGVEVCDGLDDDCDGSADFAVGVNDFEDDDGDGHADAACGGDDCDDGDWSAYAGAPEICDHRDSDCDGLSDRGATPPPGVTADATAEIDWFLDGDTDLWGATTGAVRSCEPQLGRVARGGDCADADPTTHPGAPDVCDGLDDDCDVAIDEGAPDLAFYADADADGSGAGVATLACRAPPGMAALPGDCAPTDAATGPGAAERCNAADDDCDAAVDEHLFFDDDGDGHGDPRRPVVGACVPGSAVIGTSDDCDDATTGRSPDLAETCNGVDDDCDLVADDGADASCSLGGVPGTCTAGRCTLGCAATAADCDGVPTNGCEATLATDPRHCGDCDTACGVASVCAAGACDPVVQLATASYNTCAVRAGGGVLCWGANDQAQLGRASPGSSLVPLAVPGISNAIGVAVGERFACAVLRTGEVTCWGQGLGGRLGRGEEGGSHPPRLVPGVLEAVEVAASQDVACARTSGGRVICWGGAGIGHGTSTADPLPEEIPGVTTAARLEPLDGQYSNHFGMFILLGDGRLLAAGPGPIGGTVLRRTVFAELPVGAPVRDVAMGIDGSGRPLTGCVLVTDGSSRCTGGNAEYAFGDMLPDSFDALRPAHPLWAGALEITAGAFYTTCALFPDGTVRCSGSCGGVGARGDGCSPERQVIDSLVAGVADVTHIFGGSGRVCALERDGDLWCWGPGPNGQLGYGGTDPRSTPVRARTE